jgi:hypothetical protein
MAAVGLQVQSEVNPYNYLNVIYMQFGMIALSVIIFFCLPESPCEWRSSFSPREYQTESFVQGGP